MGHSSIDIAWVSSCSIMLSASFSSWKCTKPCVLFSHYSSSTLYGYLPMTIIQGNSYCMKIWPFTLHIYYLLMCANNYIYITTICYYLLLFLLIILTKKWIPAIPNTKFVSDYTWYVSAWYKILIGYNTPREDNYRYYILDICKPVFLVHTSDCNIISR